MQDKQISSEKFMSLRNVFTTAAERYTSLWKKSLREPRGGASLPIVPIRRNNTNITSISSFLECLERLRNCRGMDDSARVIMTKAQNPVAAGVIRRRNIERNKRAINAKHQTTLERRYLASVGRARARAREIGPPRARRKLSFSFPG